MPATPSRTRATRSRMPRRTRPTKSQALLELLRGPSAKRGRPFFMVVWSGGDPLAAEAGCRSESGQFGVDRRSVERRLRAECKRVRAAFCTVGGNLQRLEPAKCVLDVLSVQHFAGTRAGLGGIEPRLSELITAINGAQ